MNIKSLLIGSAAALATVSGTYAADAVVAAEPEPMEYVRVCDAYGAGYFYIPGTETCLKIGGWVRYEIYAGRRSSLGTGWSKRARARVEFEAKNDSELGTVSSYIRYEFGTHSWDIDTTAPGMQTIGSDLQYSLGVGGLEMGYRDSQWNRFGGYGGFTDGGGWNYGYRAAHYISYQFSNDAFSGIISLDHDDDADYLPDVMAGVAGKFGSVDARLSVGWDGADLTNIAGAAAVKLNLTAAVGVAKVRLMGLYASGPNGYWYDGGVGSAWSIIAGVSAPLGEKASAALDFQYFDTGAWAVIGDLSYTIAKASDGSGALTSLLEVDYRSNGTWGGMLRFQRSF